MVTESRTAMGHYWPWVSWAGAEFCPSVVLSDGQRGFWVEKLCDFPSAMSVPSSWAAKYPPVWLTELSPPHHGD